MEKGLLSLFTGFGRLSHELLGVTHWATHLYDISVRNPLLFLE